MREMTVGRNDAGQRLDKFLTKAIPTLPPALLYKSIRTKKIKVNRKRAEPGQLLTEGDVLQLFLAEELFSLAPIRTAPELGRIKTKLNVIYEDQNLLLLDKRAGVSVHEDESGSGDNLLTAMQAYLYARGEYDPESEQSFAPALCNRIDRNTAGIVIAAKNAETLREVNALIRDRRLGKFYLCAVHGVPHPPSATLKGFLRKDEKTKTVTVYLKNPPRDAKPIATRYRVIREKDDLALLEVELLTGRTHQIRAHLAAIGHPLLGEGKYGVNRDDRRRGFRHQALASVKLSFPSDLTGHLAYLAGKTFCTDTAALPFVRLF